jgi:hypothetical protein
VYQLGCSTDDFFLDHGFDLNDMNIPVQDVVNTLLALDMVDNNKKFELSEFSLMILTSLKKTVR